MGYGGAQTTPLPGVVPVFGSWAVAAAAFRAGVLMFGSLGVAFSSSSKVGARVKTGVVWLAVVSSGLSMLANWIVSVGVLNIHPKTYPRV